MKEKKLLALAVASALGLGVTGYAQAQAVEGCKAYVTGTVDDLRLVNPVSNNIVSFVGTATAQGSNTAGIVIPTGNATTGNWNDAIPVIDADPACISAIGGAAVDAGSPPCPPNNSFNQILPFEDFGRADSLDEPGTAFAPGQPDVPGLDFDDFELACAAQRSATNQATSANGNSTNQVAAVEIFLADSEPDTQTLEWRGDFAGTAESIVSPGTTGSAASISNANFEVFRVSDSTTIQCDSDAIELSAPVPAGPGVAGPLTVPAGTKVICNAGDFPAGTQQVFSPFQADGVTPEQYRVSANIGCNANCTVQLVSPPEQGFKAYFAKQRAPFEDRIPEATVQVTDQFQSREYSTILLHELWNSALKNEEPPPALDDPRLLNHKTCYKVRPTPGQDLFIPPTVEIETTNFGTDTFRLGQPWELCLPAQKTVLPDGVPQGSSTTGNHYLCYTANSAPKNVPVTLDDQFGREEVDVTKLEQFCAPAGKNDPNYVPPVEDPANPDTWSHLACYSIFEQSGPELPIDVNVVDQFAPAPGVTLTVEKPRQWCEPAYKASVTPRGGPLPRG